MSSRRSASLNGNEHHAIANLEEAADRFAVVESELTELRFENERRFDQLDQHLALLHAAVKAAEARHVERDKQREERDRLRDAQTKASLLSLETRVSKSGNKTILVLGIIGSIMQALIRYLLGN